MPARVALLAALVGKAYADLCDSMHGIQCSLPQSDIGYHTHVTSHDQCCALCKEKAGCKAWSWKFTEGHCHLHSSCQKIPNSAYHSGSSDGPSPGPPSPPAPPSPGPPSPPGPAWTVTIFHWNIHHQCGQDSGSCREAGKQRFGELVHEIGADIAVGIELHGASSALSGWHATREYEDAVSLMLAPGWTVHKTGGGQIVSGTGARGVAVALVTPPHAVHGCPQLCVMGVHPGHSHITGGKGIVDGVCGSSVADHCSIATGDWNMPASTVRYSSWPNLIGGSPSVVAPDSQTCCVGKTCCQFDHAGTNIAGASDAGSKVWPYQMTSHFKMAEEHMPTSLKIRLPGSSADLVDWTNESTITV